MSISPPWNVIIGTALAGIAVALILDDHQRETRRREEAASLAASARAARELPPLPQPWPTPAPMPRAEWSSDGFVYEAVRPEFDPCGSGPLRLVRSSDEDEAVAS